MRTSGHRLAVDQRGNTLTEYVEYVQLNRRCLWDGEFNARARVERVRVVLLESEVNRESRFDIFRIRQERTTNDCRWLPS